MADANRDIPELGREDIWRLLTREDYQIQGLMSQASFERSGHTETWHFVHPWDDLQSNVEYLLEMSVTFEQGNQAVGSSITVEAHQFRDLSTGRLAELIARGFFSRKRGSGWSIGMNSPAAIQEVDFSFVLNSVLDVGMELAEEVGVSLEESPVESTDQFSDNAEDPRDLQFDLAIATYRSGKEKKALKMLKSLSKKGHSPSIWELFNLAINSGDLREARTLYQFEGDSVQLALLQAVLTEAESGIDVGLYEDAFELGHAGAAFHLTQHFASLGDFARAKHWLARTEELGLIDEERMAQLRETIREPHQHVTLETTAKKLIEMASTGTSVELQGLLTEHESCFLADQCDVCTYMDEELDEWLLVCMAGNPHITEELENSIHSAAVNWQGRDTSVLMALSENQSLSENMKEIILDADIWYGMGDGEELVEQLLEIMEENPIYSAEEIEEFKNYCESEYGYGSS